MKIYESKVTSKGQTTIPVEVRERLQVKAGDMIQFVFVDGSYKLIPRNKSAAALVGRLQKYAIQGTTLSDYRDAVAHYFEKDAKETDGKDEAA